MSRLGPIQYSDDESTPFLGQDIMHRKSVSDKTAEQVDNEVERLIARCYAKAKKLLSDNIIILKRLSDALNDRETLTSGQIDELVEIA